MKAWRLILAALCGLAVLATGAVSALVSHKMGIVFRDLGEVPTTGLVHLLLATPRALQLVLALLLGAATATLMLMVKPARIAVVLAALTGFLVVLYLNAFVAAFLRPVGELITKAQADGTNGVPANAARAPGQAADPEKKD